MKRLHRYWGAKSLSDLKTIVLDSLPMTSSMVSQPNSTISGLLGVSSLLFVMILSSTILELLQLVNICRSITTPDRTIVSKMGINITGVKSFQTSSGEVRGHACHAEHDKTFSKITFFQSQKNSFLCENAVSCRPASSEIQLLIEYNPPLVNKVGLMMSPVLLSSAHPMRFNTEKEKNRASVVILA